MAVIPVSNIFDPSKIDGEASLETAINRLDTALKNLPAKNVYAAFLDLLDGPELVFELFLTLRHGNCARLRRMFVDAFKTHQPLVDVLERVIERCQAMLISLPTTEVTLPRQALRLVPRIQALLSHDSRSPVSPRKYTGNSRKKSKGSFSVPNSPVATTSRRTFEDQQQGQGDMQLMAEKIQELFDIFLDADVQYRVQTEHLRRACEVLTAEFGGSGTSVPELPLTETLLAAAAEEAVRTVDRQSIVVPQNAIRFLATDDWAGDRWPLVIAQRAFRALRRHSLSNDKLFKHLDACLTSLAKQSLTCNVHTPLKLDGPEVKLYTRDVTKCLRVIYQVDHGYPLRDTFGGSKQSNYIKVYDICDNEEIDQTRRFWSMVSSHLNRMGASSKRRADGSTSLSTAETLPPMKLDTRSRAVPTTSPLVPEEAEEEDYLDLHRLMAIEKYIPFTTDLIEKIRYRHEDDFAFAISSREDEIIHCPTSCLVLGRSGTGKTTTMLFRMLAIEERGCRTGDKYRQVFVTQSVTLANKVEAFFRRLIGANATDLDRHDIGAFTLHDIDDEIDDDGSLPNRWTELEDSDFPLFVTIDQLYRLLEGEVGLREISPKGPILGQTRSRKPGPSQPFVSFKYFEKNLWDRFDENLKKGLSAALVFNEILGTIKGSELTLARESRCLDMNTYTSQSERIQSSLIEARGRIYKLFQAYCKKRPSGSFDAADRTHALLASLGGRIPGRTVDCLYVDEVQDNLIIDIALLKLLCSNPNGTFFAGDTAQTISAGSTFRFKDLKSFIYRFERNTLKRMPPADPAFFELTVNYRSHGKVVKLAASIVDLLTQLFPMSIDVIDPETAKVDGGPTPTIFTQRSQDDDLQTLLSQKKTGKLGLGANQAIIVRSEEAAQQLQDRLGNSGELILTLYQSKGLEFNDVLLYDFFAGSDGTETDWRACVRAALGRGDSFDGRKHAILQSELKSLYVGITRAKERLYIWDSSAKGVIMEGLLTEKQLCVSYKKAVLPRFGTESKDTDWVDQARKLFARHLYVEAAHSFEKGGKTWWRDVSLAYRTRQKATDDLPINHPDRKAAFNSAGKEFETVAKSAPASTDSDALKLFANAAKCFEEAGKHIPAATCFKAAGKYNEAVYHYREGGNIEAALQIIRRHPGVVDAELVKSIQPVRKVHFTTKDPPEEVIPPLEDTNEPVQVLEDHGLQPQELAYVPQEHRYEDIRDDHLQMDDEISDTESFGPPSCRVVMGKASWADLGRTWT